MNIHGVYPAMITPLHADGSINFEELKKLTQFLLDSGVDGLFPVSSIGEGIHFSIEESVEVTKAVLEVNKGRVLVLPGATTSCAYNSIKLIEEYKKLGITGVVVAPPYFYSTSDNDIAKHYSEITDKTGIGVVAYNIPLFATPISDAVLQKLLANPKIIGVKDSSGNGIALLQMIDSAKSKNSATKLFIGREELFLGALQSGVDGAMLGTASIFPELYVAIKKHFEAGNMEQATICQLSIIELVKTMFKLPFPLGFKEAMSKRGFEMGGIRKAIDFEKIPNAKEVEDKIGVLLQRTLDTVGAKMNYLEK